MNNLNFYLTSILVVITCWYAYSTYRLVKENEKFRKELKKPFIVLDIDNSNPPFYYCVIKNLGNGPAKNVKFKIDPDIPYGKESNIKLSDIPLFKNLQFIPPNKEIRFFLGSALQEIKGKPLWKYKFSIQVRYEDIFKEYHEDKYEIDLSAYEYLLRETRRDLNDFYKILGEIKKIFNEIKDSIKKMYEDRVNVAQSPNLKEIFEIKEEPETSLKNLISMVVPILEIISTQTDNKGFIFSNYPGIFEYLSLLRKVSLKIMYISKIIHDRDTIADLARSLSTSLFDFSIYPIIKQEEIRKILSDIEELNSLLS